MKNPKAKGGQFEREVCVALSKWLSFNTRNDLLWRAAMSGGRATVAKKKGDILASQSGDITSTDPLSAAFISKFYCECKNYTNLKFHGLITHTGELYSFWQSTVTEANCYKKNPMLIAKQNRMPTVVFLQMSGVTTFGLNMGHCILIAPRIGAYGILFEDFLVKAKPL